MADELFLIHYREDKDNWALQIGETCYTLDSRQIPDLDWLLRNIPVEKLADEILQAKRESVTLSPSILRAPVEQQEIWAAGLTYKRSGEAHVQESAISVIYTQVYNAFRPELFFKGMGYDAVGSGQKVGIRYDSKWSAPEPELVVVLNPRMEVVGFTIGNDMGARDIESENPLYVPQAKLYTGSCAIGPRLWLQPNRTTWPDVTIQMQIHRQGQVVFRGETSTAAIHRTLADLVDYLGRCKQFPNGVLLFTGTGVMPPESFTLQAEDEIRIRIDPIGELVNTVAVTAARH